MSKYVAMDDIISGPFREINEAEAEQIRLLDISDNENKIIKGDCCIGQDDNGLYYVYDSGKDVISSSFDRDELEANIIDIDDAGNMFVLLEISCER